MRFQPTFLKVEELWKLDISRSAFGLRSFLGLGAGKYNFAPRGDSFSGSDDSIQLWPPT